MPRADDSLHVAFYRHRQDNRPRLYRLAWDKLAERLLTHQERRDKDGPMWSPTHYVAGSTRANRNVLAVTAAVGDFDDGTTWEEVKQRLDDYEYVAHSTHSSTPERPRFRVVIPLSRPISRDDWPEIRRRIDHHVFGLATDPATKDPSRAYYLPSCPPGALRFAERHRGRWLDARSLPECPREIAPPAGTGRATVPLGKAALDFVANGAPIGEQRLRAVAAARNYLSAGYSVEQTAEAIWRGLQVSPSDPDREPWTRDDAYQIASDLASKPAPPIELYAAEPPAAFRRDGMGYTFEPAGTQVCIRADYLNHRGDDVTAELAVTSRLPGAPSRLYRGRLNLCAVNSKRSLATDLEELCRRAVDRETWRALLEQFSQFVLEAERQGEPFQHVGNLPAKPRETPRYHVERLLPSGKPTLLYGPGGVGKGWVAVAVCCAVQAGVELAGLRTIQCNTLYLDWEDDRETLDERVKAVARGMGIPVPPTIGYRKCRFPLSHQVNQIARYVAENNVGLVVVDSVGLAAGAAGERGTYEEVALRFFDSLRQVGDVTWLCIDHVSEQARQNTAGQNKAFGSVYKMNEARMAWEIRKDQEAGASESHLGLYNTKNNHGPIEPPIGLRLEFEEGIVRIEREDVRDSAELARPLSDRQRILGELRSGPLLTNDLAETLGKPANIIRAQCNTLLKRGEIVKLPDGHWALAARQRRTEEDTVVHEIPF